MYCVENCTDGTTILHSSKISFFSYDGMDGEPDCPEYRVPVREQKKEVILRVESARNVVVRSVMFIRTSVLENDEINFDESEKIFWG